MIPIIIFVYSVYLFFYEISYTITIRKLPEIKIRRTLTMAKLYTITLNGVTEETYNQATDYIQKNALRLNYRPAASTIDVEFPDTIDPGKAPELKEAVITPVHQTL